MSALTLSGDEYGIADEVDELLAIWADHLGKNQLRRRYYDGENVLKDLGISIPPSLRNIETVVGWPKKAVSAMASRSRFDGFTVGDEALASQIDQLVRRCNLKRKYKQACESELIAGCDFVTLSKGADGEPPVIVVTHSAEDGAAKWSERLGRISSGLVIMHYDASGAPDELALYTDEATYHVDGRDALMVTRMAHRMGRPLMEALAYNPTESQPLGQSRITRAVRFITDSGVREALRTEISAEFFIPARRSTCSAWTATPFENRTRWEAYIGNIFTVSQTEDGTTPTFGQLSQGSMQPHTDYMRSLAARFSGETNVPVSQLGVIHDNPSSAEAITQANEPLIMEVTDLNEGNGEALVSIAKMALAIANDTTPDAYDELQIAANFQRTRSCRPSPLRPTPWSRSRASCRSSPPRRSSGSSWASARTCGRRSCSRWGANANQRAILSLMGGGAQAVG